MARTVSFIEHPIGKDKRAIGELTGRPDLVSNARLRILAVRVKIGRPRAPSPKSTSLSRIAAIR